MRKRIERNFGKIDYIKFKTNEGYGVLYIVFGVTALIGGISALRRRVWGFALAGAILSLWMLPIGSVLGIISIIFLIKSKKEFV